MSDAGGAGQKASRSADPAPATKDKKQRTAKLPPSNYPLALLPTAGGDGQDEGAGDGGLLPGLLWEGILSEHEDL